MTPGQAAYLEWHGVRFPGTLARVASGGWEKLDDNARDAWEAAAQARAPKAVEAVVVRPGDKLIIASPNRLTMQAAHDMKAHAERSLPGVDVVIISECSGLAVYRDEPTGIVQLNRVLSEEEVTALRERGVIDENGRTFGDKMADFLDRHA